MIRVLLEQVKIALQHFFRLQVHLFLHFYEIEVWWFVGHARMLMGVERKIHVKSAQQRPPRVWVTLRGILLLLVFIEFRCLHISEKFSSRIFKVKKIAEFIILEDIHILYNRVKVF